MSEREDTFIASKPTGKSLESYMYVSPKAGLEEGLPMEPKEIEFTVNVEVGTAMSLGDMGYFIAVKPDETILTQYRDDPSDTKRVFLEPTDETRYLSADKRFERNFPPLTEKSKKALRIFSY